ncbi:MAG: OmcA/MtrC family decaheme c-type cytochrome [Thermoanaerobaculia bacterium]|nr:OmcA/MtrC family decaheme c-type cytochrome [Thermoanaerobaculia bacterium]
MSLLQRGLMFVLAAGTLAIPSSVPPDTRAGGRAAAPVEPQTVSVYTPADKEFYLTEDQMDFIRPGFKVVFGTVTDMAPGKKPSVEVTLLDQFDQPLDRLGGKTPGVISLRFIPAVWDPATGYYDDLINSSNGYPSRDNTGKWEDLGNGKYKYTFAATMPNFDVNKPMTLAVTGNRNMVDYLGKSYYVNTFKDFVPATGAAATTWAVTTTAKCNACHDPIVGHGSNYREAKTCALCHNKNDMAGDNQPYDMGIWHRIHSSNLEDVGDIHYPQYYLNNCEACHDSKQPQGTVYLTKPGANSCGGCHADIDFAAGVGHPAQANDSACANCHQPDSGVEFDASVKGAHTLLLESKQLKGLKAEILSVTNTAPGQNPIVTFKLSDSTGVLDPKPFGSNANVLLAGPTTDYATWPNIRESVANAVFNGTNAVYTMKWKVPEDFKGTITYSMDVRRSVTVNGRTFNEGAFNPIFNAAATGSVVPRRNVVSQAKCLACHDWLPLHGGQRLAVAECLLCHAPNGDDASRRPAANGPAESVQMARMIHRIHAGAELTQEYTIYGYGGTPYNFNGVHYPGDLRNCTFCHTSAGTANLPAPKGTLNVITMRDYFTPQGPGTAACLGCHDTRDAAAHAYLNTAVFGEACGACHGANSEWSVTKVHAR